MHLSQEGATWYFESTTHIIDCNLNRNDCSGLVLSGGIVLFTESHDVDALQHISAYDNREEELYCQLSILTFQRDCAVLRKHIQDRAGRYNHHNTYASICCTSKPGDNKQVPDDDERAHKRPWIQALDQLEVQGWLFRHWVQAWCSLWL